MASTDHRLARGRRRGRSELAKVAEELRTARRTAGLSQDTVAAGVGCSQATYWRLEENLSEAVSVIRLAEVASVLGMELSIRVFPLGDPIRDKAQQWWASVSTRSCRRPGA